MKIKIKLLHPDAVLPTYAHPGDAGLDLYALTDDEIKPQAIKRIDFGFALELPAGYMALTRDRSSFAKNGIHNLGGVFDSGYRGEYNCTLMNLTQKTYQIKKGDKVTQLVIIPVAGAELEQADELNDTARKAGRFGSTGK